LGGMEWGGGSFLGWVFLGGGGVRWFVGLVYLFIVVFSD